MSELDGNAAVAYPQAASPRRVWLWVAVPAVVAALVCAGLAGGSYIARRQAASAGRIPITARNPAVSPPSPQASRPVAIHLPARVLGRSRSSDKALARLADQAIAERGTQPGQEVVAGYYGSFARENLLFVLGVRAPAARPDDVLAQIRTALQARQRDLILAPVPAGPLGGVAECGDARAAGSPMAVCVWVDSGSYGFVQFFGTTVAKSGDLFLAARGQIEKPL